MHTKGDVNIWGDVLVMKGSYNAEGEVVDISFEGIKLVETVLWW